jgi:hypothetical protein
VLDKRAYGTSADPKVHMPSQPTYQELQGRNSD